MDSYMPKVVPSLLAVVLVTATLVSCSKEKQDASGQTDAVAASPVLVEVNGSPVTAQELELAVERTFGEAAALYMSEELEQKLLQSLISSRAISQKALGEMSEAELRWLELKVQAYKEELLIKYYLEEHAQAEPVTNEMVKAYYQQHQEKFGGGKIRQFEYVQVRIPQGSDVAKVVEPLNALKAADNWEANLAIVESVDAAWQVSYKKASLETTKIQPPLDSMLPAVKVGEVAPLKFEKNTYTLLRSLGEKELPVKPLSEVSAEIRKMLSPIQLKKAVKAISDEALATAEVKHRESAQ